MRSCMMRSVLAAVVGAGFLSPAMAQSNPADMAALRNALASAGCVVTRESNRRVTESSGLTLSAGRAAVQALVAAGEIVVDGENARLVTGECASSDVAAPSAETLEAHRTLVTQAIAARTCRVRDRELDSMSRSIGLNRAEVGLALIDLANRGDVQIERNGGTEDYVLIVAPCAPAVAPAPTETK